MKRFVLILSVTVLLTCVLGSNGYNKNDRDEVVQQLIEAGQKQDLNVDESKIRTQAVDGDGIMVTLPTFADSEVHLTTEDLKNGDTTIALQCIKSERRSGCFNVKIRDINYNKRYIDLSIVDAEGKVAGNGQLSEVSPVSPPDVWIIVFLFSPIYVFYNGFLIGPLFYLVTVIAIHIE